MTKKHVYRSHQYPSLLFRYPWLILPYYVFTILFYPRNLRFFFELKRKIKRHNPKVILEIGIGEGLHLFLFGLLFKKIRFYGYDIRDENVNFVNRLCHYFSLHNVTVLDIDEFENITFRNFDFIYLVGVLQYIQNDTDFLCNTRDLLSSVGKIFLYQPVHYKRYIQPLQKIVDKYEHYEKEVGLIHQYSESALMDIFKKSHLKTIEIKRYAYIYSSVAHEIFSALYVPFVKDSRLAVKMACSIGLTLIWPLLTMLHAIDSKAKSGIHNALLVELESNTVN